MVLVAHLPFRLAYGLDVPIWRWEVNRHLGHQVIKYQFPLVAQVIAYIMDMKLNINKFLTVCTHLAFEASRIIRDVYQSSQLNIVIKDQARNDPVTEADFKAQTLILRGLRKQWPDLNIVGEEVKDFEGEILYDYQALNQNIFPLDLFSRGKKGELLEETLDMSQVVVWVDPLDATLSYTQGYLDEVTTLIGLSYQNKSRLGVIGLPFKKAESKQIQYLFNPTVYVADSLNSVAYQVSTDFSFKEIKPGHHQEQIRLCTTRSKLNEEVVEFLSSVSKDLRRMGGMGKKGLEVALGNCDALVYLGRGICNWDVCAPESLIACLNGGCTKSTGEPFSYRVCESGEYVIREGCVLSIDQQLQAELLAKITQAKL